MKTPVEKTIVNKKQSAGKLTSEPVPGDVLTPHFFDNRPQSLLQRKAQLAADNSDRLYHVGVIQEKTSKLNDERGAPKTAEQPTENQTIQRVAQKVRITWGITHLVKKMNNSLFGGDDYQEGEIDALGELHAGQTITIDNEKTFTSRRGPNQENSTIRAMDKLSEPSYLWYHVLSLRGQDVSSEKLYVRDGTFGQAPELEIERLSKVDEGLLKRLITGALASGKEAGGPWETFLQSAVKSHVISNAQASYSRLMIHKMYGLHVLGRLLKRYYSQFQFAIQLDLAPAQGMKLFLPLVGKIYKEETGITINALMSGGDAKNWTSLSHMLAYFKSPFETFSTLFASFDSTNKIGLLKTLRSKDSNMEKFVNLMVSHQLIALAQAAGPEEELAAELAGHSTASGGNGAALIGSLAAYLQNKYLLTKYTQDQINKWEYDETDVAFYEWLGANGYTYEIMRNAIRISARDNSDPISTSAVRESFVKFASVE